MPWTRPKRLLLLGVLGLLMAAACAAPAPGTVPAGDPLTPAGDQHQIAPSPTISPSPFPALSPVQENNPDAPALQSDSTLFENSSITESQINNLFLDSENLPDGYFQGRVIKDSKGRTFILTDAFVDSVNHGETADWDKVQELFKNGLYRKLAPFTEYSKGMGDKLSLPRPADVFIVDGIGAFMMDSSASISSHRPYFVHPDTGASKTYPNRMDDKIQKFRYEVKYDVKDNTLKVSDGYVYIMYNRSGSWKFYSVKDRIEGKGAVLRGQAKIDRIFEDTKSLSSDHERLVIRNSDGEPLFVVLFGGRYGFPADTEDGFLQAIRMLRERKISSLGISVLDYLDRVCGLRIVGNIAYGAGAYDPALGTASGTYKVENMSVSIALTTINTIPFSLFNLLTETRAIGTTAMYIPPDERVDNKYPWMDKYEWTKKTLNEINPPFSGDIGKYIRDFSDYSIGWYMANNRAAKYED